MATRSPHTAVPMVGRDPHEHGRVSTPLELLFDLTFAIAFGVAADELTDLLVHDHVVDGLLAFVFAVFAVSWAWINFSWFASAYDTDDWVYRLTTMVQMVGVLVLALGLAPMFESLAEGEHLDNRVMVLGYVVMRIPMVLQWLRAGAQDPGHRDAVRVTVVSLLVAQAGWIALALVPLGIGPTLLLVVVLVGIELAGPVLSQSRHAGTPWHAHHIAERYGLFVIITLGEALLGTVAALRALVADGWTLEVGLLGLAGVALTFGMWWIYFIVPSGEILHLRRERSFGWGYGHLPVFGAVVGVGAGLHAAAYFLEDDSTLGPTGTVLTVAVPLAVYMLGTFGLSAQLSRGADPLHLLLIALTAVPLVAAVVLAGAGVPMVWSLLLLAMTPWVTVVGYELVGHRHHERVIASLQD